MAQDEHFVSSSNSGGGGGAAGAGAGAGNNRSKTPKPKKAPQRGLGVAQLEKLRIEEQRKKEALLAANVLANNAIGSGNESLPGRNIGGGPIPMTNQSSDGGGEDTLWSGECNSSCLEEGGMEKQKVVVDHAGFLFGGPQVNVNLRFEPGVPVLPQRPYQFQRPPSQMVNVSSPLSSSRIEPPSIQSVCGINYTPSWPEDDKIVGIKRLYPFSLEGPQTPSFLGGNVQTTYGELASCSNEPRNKYTRDSASNSTLSVQNPSEDERLIGGFLSLAPPSNTKNKHQPLDFLGHHQGPDLSDHKSLSTQENIKSSQSHQLGLSSSNERAFTFFPIKSQTENSRNGNGDKGEKLDLNLKL